MLSHRLSDGTERPIAFASRSLAEAERRYAQIEREALALLFGVKKFHQYLSGRAFTILTDHKPSVSLLGENKGVPLMASGHMQRWAIMLSGYQYKLRYRPGTTNANSDALSRLPLPVKPEVTENPSESVISLHILKMTPARPIPTVQLRQFTDRDGQLTTVRHYVLSGWPREVNSELRHYWNRRHELSVLGGCVLWGSRVIIPQEAWLRVLEELHVAHPGVSRMKSQARSYTWWPGLDADIEDSKILRDMPRTSAITSKSASSPLGTARTCVVEITYRLCWAILGSVVRYTVRCVP